MDGNNPEEIVLLLLSYITFFTIEIYHIFHNIFFIYFSITLPLYHIFHSFRNFSPVLQHATTSSILLRELVNTKSNIELLGIK